MSASGWYAVALLDDCRREPVQFRMFGVDGIMKFGPEGRLQVLLGGHLVPFCVRASMVFAWIDEIGREPDFALPILGGEGWTEWAWTHLDVDTDPHWVMRDLVDVDHYDAVHGYRSARYASGPTFDGHRLSVHVAFNWDTGLPGPLKYFPASFSSEAFGLGFQLTNVLSTAGCYNTRHLVLPVPLEDGRCRILLGVSTRILGRPGQGIAGAGLRHIGHRYIQWAFRRDIARDRGLWAALQDHPTYPNEPLFVAYEAWTQQFQSQRAAS